MHMSVKKTLAMITAIIMAMSLLSINSLAEDLKDSGSSNPEVESGEVDQNAVRNDNATSTVIADVLLSEGGVTPDYEDNRDEGIRVEDRSDMTKSMEYSSSDNALQSTLEFAEVDEGADEYADLQAIIPREGYCGRSEDKNALSWVLAVDGTLTISGTGAMAEYEFYGNESPWYKIRTEVKSVLIGEGVTTVGSHAFSYCSQLTSVHLPQTLNEIGYSAFSYCTSLSNIAIPDGVSTLERYAFDHCTELEHFDVPKNISEIQSYIFEGCSKLVGIDVDSTNANYKSIDGVLFTKSGEELVCYPAGKQGGSYTIPDEVRTIGSISGNKNLKDIHIGNGVLSANESSFSECTSLSNIFYDGTRSGCKQITLGSYASKAISEIFSTDVTIHCNDGDITVRNGVVSENDVIGSGFCGIGENKDNIQWVLTTDGTLSLTGTGRMSDFSDYGDNATPWKRYRDEIKNVSVQSGITQVSRYAFYECKNLENISFPASIESIGQRAFYNCSSLRRIFIPTSVMSIGENAFMLCESLEAFDVSLENANYCSADGILFNKNMTALVSYPMGNERTSYEIPQSVSTICEDAFWGNGNLNHVSIPNSITAIDDEAFWACESLTSISIPEGVTSIGKYAFASTSLVEVNIPDGVTSIGDNAFSSCTDLRDISLPNTLTSIGSEVFEYCTSLERITIPDSVESIGSMVFYECSKLTRAVLPNNLDSIPSNLFNSCESLVDVEIPESVTNIVYHAFYQCSRLPSITIPDGVEEIESNLFYYCERLEDISIPLSVTTIADGAFNGCSNLNNIFYSGTRAQWYTVTIGERNGAIYTAIVHCTDGNINYLEDASDDTSSIISNGTCGAEADGTNINWSLTENGTLVISGTGPMQDYGYDSETDSTIEVPWKGNASVIKSVIFETGVTHIGDNLFDEGYNNLLNVVISDGVTSIGDYVFVSCNSLAGVVIPGTVRSIGNGAFTECSNLSNVTISEGVESIGNWAFQVCGLRSVQIPASVTSIGDGPFMACSQLTSIQVDDKNANYSSIDGVLFSKDKSLLIQYPAGKEETSYDIPAGVTEIGYNAFESCYNLTNVTFPSGLERIDEGAFYLCTKLGDIVFPQGLISIGSAAFRVCRRMVNVTIPNSVTMIDSGAFTFCNDFRHVYYLGTKAQWDKISIDSYNPFDDVNEDGTPRIIIHYADETSDVKYSVNVVGGTADKAEYEVGETVTLNAIVPENNRFVKWSSSDNVIFANDKAESTTFTMPGMDITVTAEYEPLAITEYEVTVNEGTGSGKYKAGDSVLVSANKAPTGMTFDKWLGADGLQFTSGSANTSMATFTMPSNNVALTATFRSQTAQSSQGCYVATSVYGSYDCPEVWTPNFNLVL